jgi:hypothetical protein
MVKNAIGSAAPTTIIASVTDQTDVDVWGHILADNGMPANIRIRADQSTTEAPAAR